jgi:hypothetical protein
MERVCANNNEDAPPRRWLGLRPVDFVRAAERRAAVLTRMIDGARSGGKLVRSVSPRPGPLLPRRISIP